MTFHQITDFIKHTRFDSLPNNVINMSKKCLLDHLGVAFAGYQTNASLTSIAASKWFGEQGKCSLYGQQELASPVAATFVNATLASSLDLDDGHRLAVGHPGCVIIPAALAAGELIRPTSGKDLLTAIVIGYEIAIRCGVVMNSNHDLRFYGSGGWGVFGAASAAAKIMDLDQTTMKHAITIGEVYGPSSQCEKSIAAGAMTKESVGWGASTAMFGALLARSGFTGPDNILLDDSLYQPHSKDSFETLGETYEIENTYFKDFPACKWAHSPITAALKLKKKYSIHHENIDSISVETFSKALTLSHAHPTTSEAAQYSIPYTVATSVYYGSFQPKHLTSTSLFDPQIRSLASKITMIQSSELEQYFPQSRPARVVIHMKDGSSFTEETHLVHGDPEHPFTWEELVCKFHDCTEPILSKEYRTKIVEQVENIEHIQDMNDFTSLLRSS